MPEDLTTTPDLTTAGRALRFQVTVDVLLILLISFVAQATHFSYNQGRALICADSAQYVASAEALTEPYKTPHFEMRKPGYILFLAGVFVLFGNMGWAAVTANHVLLGMLPLAAYGWGRHLRSRRTGWVAAILIVGRLQEAAWGDWMMSESLLVFLFSFGTLIFVIGLSREGTLRWLLPAGCLLGLSWLTRGAALSTIAVALLAIVLTMRHRWRRVPASCAWLAAPVACCMLLECGLNLASTGMFRLSTGAVGALTLARARHFEGLTLPDTPDAAKASAFLFERDRDDAYLVDRLDIWVARHRALRDLGMGEWEFDDLMGRVGRDALTDNLGAYVQSSLKLTLLHLFRRHNAQALSPVPDNRRAEPLIPVTAPDDADWDTTWYAYWGLPHLTLHDSVELVDRMKARAAQRAPFGGSPVWKTLRHWKSKPVAEWFLYGLTWLGSAWPVFALLGCFLLKLNWRICAFLAAAYVVEALLISSLTPTTARLQFIWIVTDTALAAGLIVGVMDLVVHCAARLRRQSHQVPQQAS